MNVVISNNEVTRPNGNGIFVKAQSLGKSFWTEGVSFLIWNDLAFIVQYHRDPMSGMSMLSTISFMTLVLE